MSGVIAELRHTVSWSGSAEAIDGEVLGCDGPNVCSLDGPGADAFGFVPVDEVSRVRGDACVTFASTAGNGERGEETPGGSRGRRGLKV